MLFNKCWKYNKTLANLYFRQAMPVIIPNHLLIYILYYNVITIAEGGLLTVILLGKNAYTTYKKTKMWCMFWFGSNISQNYTSSVKTWSRPNIWLLAHSSWQNDELKNILNFQHQQINNLSRCTYIFDPVYIICVDFRQPNINKICEPNSCCIVYNHPSLKKKITV